MCTRTALRSFLRPYGRVLKILLKLVKEGSKVSRKGHIPKREVMPDAKYNDRVVTKLINNVMLDGKKGVATKIVYDAFEIVGETSGNDPLEVFYQALENIMPTLEVKARRRQTLGLRWLVNFSRARGEKTMVERLSKEILDASNNAGASVKRKEEMHRAAEANKAFAHYRY